MLQYSTNQMMMNRKFLKVIPEVRIKHSKRRRQQLRRNLDPNLEVQVPEKLRKLESAKKVQGQGHARDHVRGQDRGQDRDLEENADQDLEVDHEVEVEKEDLEEVDLLIGESRNRNQNQLIV